MKKILLLLTVCTLSSGILFAQQSHDHKMDMRENGMNHEMKDCVMMKDGKMMVMKGGHTMEMRRDMTLNNGTRVMKNGTVRMKNGKRMRMKDGDAMYMNGRMEKMKMDDMNHRM